MSRERPVRYSSRLIYNTTVPKLSEYDNVHNLDLTISKAISADLKESMYDFRNGFLYKSSSSIRR